MGLELIIDNKDIYYSLPLTIPKGKARLKKRSFFYRYGVQVKSPTRDNMTQDTYVELQIGYDAKVKDVESGDKNTTLTEFTFVGANGENKHPFELSEILYHAFVKGFVDIIDIKRVYDEIKKMNTALDVMSDMQIKRIEPPMNIEIENIKFYKTEVSHPLLIHKFGDYEIYTEILTAEKQYAVGIQPQLYLCIPIINLDFDSSIIGRPLNSKECGKWKITKVEAQLSLELFKIFALLTADHKKDVEEIFKVLFNL